MYPYSMLLAGAALLGLAGYAWLQRRRPSVRSFALFMASIAVWVLCIAGWSLASTPDQALLWFRLQFIGVASAPVNFLSYTLQFTGRASALRGRTGWLLWAVPAVTVLLALSPAFQPLLFPRVEFAAAGGAMALTGWRAAPWFWLHTAYSFGLLAVGLVILIRAAADTGGIFRRQIVMLLVAMLPPIVATLLNTFQILPSDVLVMPIGFALTGAALIWSILRHQLTNVVPVARELLIEQMEDGMLVVDESGLVVDVNPAMQALAGRTRSQLLGQPVEGALAGLPALRSVLAAGEVEGGSGAALGHMEVELDSRQFYDVRQRSLLIDGRPFGRLVLLRNISRLKQVQAELFELATTDALTGLINRRQFFELARSRVALAVRHSAPLSLLLFDIDSFKAVNDGYSHEVGDQVLVAVARRTAAIMRETDLLCRYGGEEFVTLLSDTDAAVALAVAERLRQAVETAAAPGDARGLRVTVSVGVASAPAGVAPDLEALLRQADAAMYQAKRAGRNCVRMYEPPAG